ncbi:uncharacterized protein (TIGR02687 family) [Arenibacter algicola]|uniref:Uncharacterized protein (TIGR02687 family) n=1 Tax=Arenibacter algicola TaxID=616991 RepID=A0ABY3A8G9_9FLAO
MSLDNIEFSLKKLFNNHRIIFWYDTKEELSEEFENLDEKDFKKINVKGNEFEVKHILVKQEPDAKFLLYFSGERPAHEDNWLLDLELAHHVFHTDQEAMYLQELGLDYYLKELVTEHIEFFRAKERRVKLKELLGVGDEHEAIRSKMLAVVFNSDYVSLSSFIQAHGTAFIYNNEKFDKDLNRYNLANYYWGKIKTRFNYEVEIPSIYDFLLEVFNSNFDLGGKAKIPKESKLLLSLWQDSIQYKESFGKLSEKISVDIDLENKLNNISLDAIIDDNLFKLSDFKIIHELTDLILGEEISLDKSLQYIKQRENKNWYNQFENFYQCLEFGAKTISLIRKYRSRTFKSFNEGTQAYALELYEVDKMYRKFIWNYRQTNQNRILSDLCNKIEKVYSNDWLLAINNNWQSVIDDIKEWPTKQSWSQQQFFEQHVKPFMVKKQRLFVIISDALRYECGVELNNRLLAENRFQSYIEPIISSLPSYTQLGMASLLPNKDISFKGKSIGISVDGISSSGVQGRGKILETNSGVRATAVKAEDFMKMNAAKDGRDFVKQYDLIYIFHNRIDKTGDDKTTEEKVFNAVEDEIQFLMDMIKRIGNSLNGNNMMITSDHGFIYQYNELDESDFSASNHKGEIWKDNRRFVIGRGLSNDGATKAFKASELNISSDADVLIPKSINRLRVKGAGSRFVHGGASLQEIVIPLLKITKQRQDTTTAVDIDIIKSTDRITTNIHAVSFIQSDLVGEQVLPRTIRAGIYAEDDELLSDHFKFHFDIAEGSERQREVKHKFLLISKATGKYKNQRVKLILEEPVEGTTKWKTYKDYYYTLNISFTNDFDM